MRSYLSIAWWLTCGIAFATAVLFCGVSLVSTHTPAGYLVLENDIEDPPRGIDPDPVTITWTGVENGWLILESVRMKAIPSFSGDEPYCYYFDRPKLSGGFHLGRRPRITSYRPVPDRATTGNFFSGGGPNLRRRTCEYEYRRINLYAAALALPLCLSWVVHRTLKPLFF